MRRRGRTAATTRPRRERRRWLQAYRELLDVTDGTAAVVVDRRGEVRLWTAGAVRLLGAEVPVGTRLDHAGLDPQVAVLVDPRAPGRDGPVHHAGRTLQVNQVPLQRRGRPAGRATLLQDRTEAERLAARLRAERDATETLRTRAHEADNRLHTVVALVQLGHVGRALDFATAALARARELHESVSSTINDPVLAALLLGKAARADERGVAVHVDPATTLPETGVGADDLVLVLGNLVDNAIDAAAATPPPRWVRVSARPSSRGLRLEVADSGPGIPTGPGVDVFAAGWTTKGGEPGSAHGQGLGLSLVAAAIRRLGGTVTVDRWVGARFVVEVPLPAAQPAPAGGEGEP